MKCSFYCLRSIELHITTEPTWQKVHQMETITIQTIAKCSIWYVSLSVWFSFYCRVFLAHKYTHLMIYTEIFHCSLLLVDRFSSVGVVGFLQYIFHTQTSNIVQCICMSLFMYAYDERKKTTYIHLSSRRFLHTWGHLNCWFSYNQINGYSIYLHLYRFLFIYPYIYILTVISIRLDILFYSFKSL